MVIPTNEELMNDKDTKELVNDKNQKAKKQLNT